MAKQYIKRLVPWLKRQDYRAILFNDLLSLPWKRDFYESILEIGPRDGQDTQRLLTLKHKNLFLIDLPHMESVNREWLKKIGTASIQYFSGNIMYDSFFKEESFDLIWCTGVLYHNPEQLRMITLLHRLLKRGGILVLESKTIPEMNLRNKNVVKINYPPRDSYKKRYHVSHNITHIPSRKAIFSWLKMVGFDSIVKSDCHRRQSWRFISARVAYIASKSKESIGTYYAHTGSPYVIGKTL